MCQVCEDVSISRWHGAGSTANARPLPAAGTGTTSVEDPAERYRCGGWWRVRCRERWGTLRNSEYPHFLGESESTTGRPLCGTLGVANSLQQFWQVESCHGHALSTKHNLAEQIAMAIGTHTMYESVALLLMSLDFCLDCGGMLPEGPKVCQWLLKYQNFVICGNFKYRLIYWVCLHHFTFLKFYRAIYLVKEGTQKICAAGDGDRFALRRGKPTESLVQEHCG